MRYIFIILLFAACSVQGQKSFKWPKPIKDSSWTEVRSDTTHGTIKFGFGPGEVVGEGIIVRITFTHWTQEMYSKKDQKRIDDYYATQEMWIRAGPSGTSNSAQDQKLAYIKTVKGYEPVIDRYTFTPYKWSFRNMVGWLNKLGGN